MVTIIESGVTFGVFEANYCYEIEKSPALALLDDGIKIAEFVLLTEDNNQLWVIEAKSSIPHPQRKPKDYDAFFADIHDKLLNSLTLTLMGTLNRQRGIYGELPDPMLNVNWAQAAIRLRLVIPRVPDKHLAPIQDKLRNIMAKTAKTWRIKPFDIKVINERLARREGLIV